MHKKIVIVLLAVFLVIMAGLSVRQVAAGSYSTPGIIGDTIGVIEINGFIGGETTSNLMTGDGTNSRDIMDAIRIADEREDIKAVLLRINSPGGTAVASQEIAIELDKLRADGKKVIVSMGDVCASGGYWIACSSDYIVANGGTLTGSIGVIMELINMEGLYDKIGLRQDVIKSGEHKDIGSSFREMTEEERTMLQEIVDDSYEQFLDQVRRGRKGKIEEERLLQIADGRIITGRKALELGLIDSLGNYYDAVDMTIQIAGLNQDSSIEVLNDRGYWDLLFNNLGAAGILRNTGLAELRYPVLEYLY